MGEAGTTSVSFDERSYLSFFFFFFFFFASTGWRTARARHERSKPADSTLTNCRFNDRRGERPRVIRKKATFSLM